MNGRTALLVVAGASLGVRAAGAQDRATLRRAVLETPAVVAYRARLDYVPAQRYAEIRGFIVAMNSEGGTLFNAPDGQTSYILARRTAPSEVEEHSRWDDVIIVRSGSGAIEVGTAGKATKGARFAAAGELRGGTIAAPSRLVLRPGDIVRIPAGVPHAFAPDGPVPWELLIVKVRRPNKPLKGP